VRWLTRPSRVPRALRWAAAIVLGSAALIGLAAPSSPAAKGAGAAAAATGTGAAPAATGAGAAVLGARAANGTSLGQVLRAAQSAAAAKGPLAALGGPPVSSPNAPSKAPEPPGTGEPTKGFPSSPALISQGFNLYEDSCSSCHGVALQGIARTAPALLDVGPGPVDFYLSTGRMPLADPTEEPLRTKPAFDRAQIDALIAFISAFGGPPASTARPADGDIAVGQQVFTSDCAGCHQIVARGGLTIGAQVPNLSKATAQEIAESVRMGPYVMPHFDAHEIDQHQLDSLARYVLYTRHPDDAGGWGIYNIGPIPEGTVAWFIGIVSLLIVARLIGERAYKPGRPRTQRGET
jgi:ubiquinol-cytochrome c reductase cytochrome c subunit